MSDIINFKDAIRQKSGEVCQILMYKDSKTGLTSYKILKKTTRVTNREIIGIIGKVYVDALQSTNDEDYIIQELSETLEDFLDFDVDEGYF